MEGSELLICRSGVSTSNVLIPLLLVHQNIAGRNEELGRTFHDRGLERRLEISNPPSSAFEALEFIEVSITYNWDQGF